MVPSIGRIVHYKLNENDAAEINRRRAGAGHGEDWPKGAVAHAGNSASEGDIYPMMITRVWGEEPNEDTVVNGQVFLDGNDTLWVTSVKQGDEQRNWFQPPRVEGKQEA